MLLVMTLSAWAQAADLPEVHEEPLDLTLHLHAP